MVGVLVECLYGYELAGGAAVETERCNAASLTSAPWERAKRCRESDLRLVALHHNRGLQSADAASLPPRPP
uniref:Uncharacterized protein n=1 Tax=Oryza meridionalis TaxID=40149 RepID=A0A0E0CL54_9ORYZ